MAYAASGRPPFGTGESMAIMYRILHDTPDVSAVPAPLRSLVRSALAKDPRLRPTARELLERLTVVEGGPDTSARAVLAHIWPPSEDSPHPRGTGSLLLEPARSATHPRVARRPLAMIRVPAAAVAAVAAVVLGLIMGHVVTAASSPRISCEPRA